MREFLTKGYLPLLIINGGHRINGAMGANLNKILNSNPILGIDIRKSPNVCLITEFKFLGILNHPVVFCWLAIHYFRVLPLAETIAGTLRYLRIGVYQVPEVTDLVTQAPAPIITSSPMISGVRPRLFYFKRAFNSSTVRCACLRM